MTIMMLTRMIDDHVDEDDDENVDLGKEVDQSILGGGTKVGSTELACYSKFLQNDDDVMMM